MACEPPMNPDRLARASIPDDSWSSLTVLSDDRMLSTLGSNLRDAYEALTEAPQPSELMRLAAMIDERRGHLDT